jgi:hypothetical protein
MMPGAGLSCSHAAAALLPAAAAALPFCCCSFIFLLLLLLLLPAATPRKSKPVVLFVFGEHAREVITSEVALWLARLLTDSKSSIYSWPELAAALQRTAAESSSSSSNSSHWPATAWSWVQQVLQRLEVQVIPIEALDSRWLVESGELCVRKTSTNVDLNRSVWFVRVIVNSSECE